MSNLSRIGWTALALLLLVPILTSIFRFFSISPDMYLPYLGFGIAMLLFYAFLPGRVGEMFN